MRRGLFFNAFNEGEIRVKNIKTMFNPVTNVLMAVIFIIGILSGVILSVRLSYNIEEAYFLTDRVKIFKHAFFSSLSMTAAVAFGSLHIVLSPIIFASVFSKGVFYGFTAGTVVKAGALVGFFKVLLGIGIYNFIFAMFFLPYAALAFTKAAECFLNRQSYVFVKRSGKKLALFTVIVTALSAMLALAEAITAASSMIS